MNALTCVVPGCCDAVRAAHAAGLHQVCGGCGGPVSRHCGLHCFTPRYATITRKKIYPTPGTNYRFAWKYWYDVIDQSGEYLVVGTDTLADAISRAKRVGIKDIRRAWEGK